MSDYTDLLREIARLVDEHDLFPTDVYRDTISVRLHAAENQRAEAFKWRRALGGKWRCGNLDGYIPDVVTFSQDCVPALPGKPDVIIFLDKDTSVKAAGGVR